MQIRCARLTAEKLGAFPLLDDRVPKNWLCHILEVEDGRWFMWPDLTGDPMGRKYQRIQSNPFAK